MIDRPDLPPAPASPVDSTGAPAFGAYAGECKDPSWARLDGPWARGPLWRILHAKRWHFAAVAGPRVVAGLAVVDLGWAANAFTYLFDRESRLLLADLSLVGIPGIQGQVSYGPGPGARTSWKGGGLELLLARGERAWQVVVRGPGGLALDATLDIPAAPTLCAIARIDGGVANCTHKSVCLPARGEARLGGRRFDLEGHAGALDHTSGLLARDTAWRWASATRADLGLNLVSGFNGPVENAVWHEGRVYPVGTAEIVYDASPRGAWRIRTLDGAVDLTFRPEGERRQDKDLVIAKSRYVQPIGVFSGTIRVGGVEIPVADLPGVTEDHQARW